MGLNDDLGLRLPEVEWSYRFNAGDVQGLSWVDGRLDPDLPPVRVVGTNGDTRFRHFPHLSFAPTYVVEQTLEAQHRGRPTAWEGLSLIFAQVGWTVSARGLLWAPYSPYPGVLSKMVEAFGVERSMHRFDPARLSRLAAMLPAWYPSRGRLDAAREVLAACDALESADDAWGQDETSPRVSLRDEVLCCHDATWWRARSGEAAKAAYRVEGGFLRFQPEEGPLFELRREDFLVALPQDGHLSLALHRLLPAWASIRLTTNAGPDPIEAEAKPQGDQKAAPEAEGPPSEKKPAKKKTASKKARSKGAEAEGDVQDALVPVEEGEDEILVMDEGGDLVELDLADFDLIEAEDPPTDPLGETDKETEAPAPRRKGKKNDKPGEK